MNVNCLSTDAPFSVFETFGFQSGRTTDKFASCEPLRSDNGLVFLPKYINSFMSLKVMQYVDFDTHGMFICEITEARVISDRETSDLYLLSEACQAEASKPRAGKGMSVRCADMYMREKNCRRISSVRCASTELRILNRSVDREPPAEEK